MKYLNAITVISLGLIISCSVNPHYDPEKAHHTDSGFQNIYYDDDKGFWAFMKWRWHRFFKDIPDADDYDFSSAEPDLEFIQNNRNKATLTWIGHTTFLIQFHGLNILTDPQFSQRASPVSWYGPKRVVAPAIEIDNLPDIDVVIISHDHYDSLDYDSVIALAQHNQQQTLTFVVPLGIKAWIDDLGLASVQTVELDWGQSHTINDVNFIAEPSQHWSKRTLFDAYERLWASWVIEAEDDRIFFGGDTGYAKHFEAIGDKYGEFQLALIPIGAYEPRWFMKAYHVNPDEAVQMHLDVNAEYSVGMHWGTFILTDEPLDEPPVKLKQALKKYNLPESAFEVYQHGETRVLDHLFVKNSG